MTRRVAKGFPAEGEEGGVGRLRETDHAMGHRFVGSGEHPSMGGRGGCLVVALGRPCGPNYAQRAHETAATVPSVEKHLVAKSDARAAPQRKTRGVCGSGVATYVSGDAAWTKVCKPTSTWDEAAQDRSWWQGKT